jgi:arsenate reductase
MYREFLPKPNSRRVCPSLEREFNKPFSAGIEAKGLDSYAVDVMKEIGIDISGQQSKTVKDIGNVEFDYVITLCDSAQKNCPFFPAKYGIIHRGFDDPIRLASSETSKQNILEHYRRIRDEIRPYIQTIPASLIGQKDIAMPKSHPSIITSESTQ